MSDRTRILIGGVPFGCDNVGDEAILECGVAIVREICPEVDIAVSTGDAEATARKLGVRTYDLFGFPPEPRRDRMIEAIQAHDVFLWCGATGLSDYPEIPLEMMKVAQDAGKRTVLWGVGMNRELNPALYRLWPGKRKALLSLIRTGTFGLFDAVAAEEHRQQRRARRKMAARLNAADLVVVRDFESRHEVQRSGVTREVVVGMDSAIELVPARLQEVALPEDVARILHSDAPKIGICISAQRKIQDEGNLVACLDRLVADGTARIVFVPMNPVTDAELMAGLRTRMARPSCAAVLEGRYEPAEVLAVTSALDVIVSSRLHLLILASIVGVPFVGISRGSKVDAFLRVFGLESVGVTEDVSFDALYAETVRVLAHRETLAARMAGVRKELLGRLNEAKTRLKKVLDTSGEIRGSRE